METHSNTSSAKQWAYVTTDRALVGAGVEVACKCGAIVACICQSIWQLDACMGFRWVVSQCGLAMGLVNLLGL